MRVLIKNGYGISRAQIYRLIADGRLNAHRIGGKILVSHAQLEEFLDRCRRGERY